MHVTEEDLILHYYQEPGRDPRVEQHLSSCAACRDELARLSKVLELVDTQPVPEPAAGFERKVWARVEPRLSQRRTWWLSRMLRPAPRWVLAGGMATVVLAAFLAGRFSQPSTSPTPQSQPPLEARDLGARVLMSAVGDHLDQSQVVLVELMNADAGGGGLANEQSRARDLVAASRLYRQTAALAGEPAIGELLDELERVLLEIANAPSDASDRDLDLLRARVASRDLLFRVRVVQAQMRERERTSASRGGSTGP